jgi:hypothetical protein
MHRKLPRELRDLVYRFLCIEDQAVPVGPYYHFRPCDRTLTGSGDHVLAMGLARGRVLDDHSQKPDPALLMPDSFIFNHAYMGRDISSEALKMYLTSNTFSICDVEDGISQFLGRAITATSSFDTSRNEAIQIADSGTIRTFMAMDSGRPPTTVRYSPVRPREWVRKLQIRLKQEQYCGDLESYYTSALGMFADECHYLRHAKNALGPLLHLPQGTALELEFVIMTSVGARQVSRQFINLLQALRNTFYTLMYADNTTIKIIHHDETVSPFPRDITLLWSLTKEQWEHVSMELPFLAPI